MKTSDGAEQEHRTGERNVLISIIDDDESVREAMAGLMLWMGFTVSTFPSAVEFLSSANPGESSCIVADVQMPELTGLEMHRCLRALGHNVPTILITAFPSEEARAQALADGIVCYLSKPFDVDVLMECVRSALGLQEG